MTDQQRPHNMSDEIRRLGLRMAELIKEKGAGLKNFYTTLKKYRRGLIFTLPYQKNPYGLVGFDFLDIIVYY